MSTSHTIVFFRFLLQGGNVDADEVWQDPNCGMLARFGSLLMSLTAALGSALGNELFITLFFPFLIINVDAFLGRRVCYAWAVTQFVGQALKVSC